MVWGQLYAILSNPVYVGRIRHKNTVHDGLHAPIVDLTLWKAVQDMLADNRTGEKHVRAVVYPSGLAFLDPAIVQWMAAGKTPADFTLETLRLLEPVPALWSAQRFRHRIATAP